MHRHHHDWAPVLQLDDDVEDEGSVGGVRLEEALPPPGGVGVEGGLDDFEQLEEEGGGAGEGGGRGVVIKGLRKEFGSKVAVAGLDLRLRVGDITCLLGHNGAGECFLLLFVSPHLFSQNSLYTFFTEPRGLDNNQTHKFWKLVLFLFVCVASVDSTSCGWFSFFFSQPACCALPGFTSRLLMS